jgi:hypothetical protein
LKGIGEFSEKELSFVPMMFRYCGFINSSVWRNRASKVTEKAMMFYIMEVNYIMFCAANINSMLVIMDFLFYLWEQEDQQYEQG